MLVGRVRCADVCVVCGVLGRGGSGLCRVALGRSCVASHLAPRTSLLAASRISRKYTKILTL